MCRSFIKGDAGKKSAFATRLAGSSDLYAVNQRYVCCRLSEPYQTERPCARPRQGCSARTSWLSTVAHVLSGDACWAATPLSIWLLLAHDSLLSFFLCRVGWKASPRYRKVSDISCVAVLCRKPYHGVNFVIAHDGFTLNDLVTYNSKRNEANGEDNKDGSNDNFSWNCGAEGPTEDAGINHLRQRQMRNLMLALMLAQGTPMVLSGQPGTLPEPWCKIIMLFSPVAACACIST